MSRVHPTFKTVMVLVSVLVSGSLVIGTEHHCEEIQEGMCKYPELGYNRTVLPNLLGQGSQEAAIGSTQDKASIIFTLCGEISRRFLCVAYLPPCTELGEPIPPCREFCERVRNDQCSVLVQNLRISWPEQLSSCDRLPYAVDSSSICITESGEPSLPIRPRAAAAAPAVTTSSAASAPGQPDPLSGAGGAEAKLPAVLERLLEDHGSRLGRIIQLQEENMKLQQRKLRMEIRVLQQQLPRL